eukprot:COSAG01_NODE_90_length_27307_cov_734.166458_12_plen_48_part_00
MASGGTQGSRVCFPEALNSFWRCKQALLSHSALGLSRIVGKKSVRAA